MRILEHFILTLRTRYSIKSDIFSFNDIPSSMFQTSVWIRINGAMRRSRFPRFLFFPSALQKWQRNWYQRCRYPYCRQITPKQSHVRTPNCKKVFLPHTGWITVSKLKVRSFGWYYFEFRVANISFSSIRLLRTVLSSVIGEVGHFHSP